MKIIARSGGGGGGVVLGGGTELELKPEKAVVVELPVCWLLLVVVRAHSLRPQAFHQQLCRAPAPRSSLSEPAVDMYCPSK